MCFAVYKAKLKLPTDPQAGATQSGINLFSSDMKQTSNLTR